MTGPTKQSISELAEAWIASSLALLANDGDAEPGSPIPAEQPVHQPAIEASRGLRPYLAAWLPCTRTGLNGR
jgi:hypothetical protein